jgi:hypothetical protein
VRTQLNGKKLGLSSPLPRKCDPISKIIKAKEMAGGVVQAIEYLPHKLKALSSNSIPPKC